MLNNVTLQPTNSPIKCDGLQTPPTTTTTAQNSSVCLYSEQYKLRRNENRVEKEEEAEMKKNKYNSPDIYSCRMCAHLHYTHNDACVSFIENIDRVCVLTTMNWNVLKATEAVCSDVHLSSSHKSERNTKKTPKKEFYLRLSVSTGYWESWDISAENCDRIV